jgi:hypothetical protein
MTLLNWLFGNRKKIATELAFDEEKRMKLWQEHLDNFKEREKLCTAFNYKNVTVFLLIPGSDQISLLEAFYSYPYSYPLTGL